MVAEQPVVRRVLRRDCCRAERLAVVGHNAPRPCDFDVEFIESTHLSLAAPKCRATVTGRLQQVHPGRRTSPLGVDLLVYVPPM